MKKPTKDSKTKHHLWTVLHRTELGKFRFKGFFRLPNKNVNFSYFDKTIGKLDKKILAPYLMSILLKLCNTRWPIEQIRSLFLTENFRPLLMVLGYLFRPPLTNCFLKTSLIAMLRFVCFI